MRLFCERYPTRARVVAAACVVVGLLGGAGLRTAEPAAEAATTFQPEDVEFFEAKIRPVLVKHCYACHSTESTKLQGGLLLDNRSAVLAGGESGPVVVVGKPEASELIAALRYEGYEMPPDGRLPETVVKDFEEWILRGLQPRWAGRTRSPACCMRPTRRPALGLSTGA